MMRLLAALFLALGLAFAPLSARAEPISAAITAIAAAGSIGGAVAGVGTIAAFAINAAVALGVSLGLSALSSALSTKPKAQAGETLSGVETSVQIGGDIARQICIGRVGAKGQLVYHNTVGANNEHYQRVFVLSDWRSAGIAGVFVNGARHDVTVLGSGDGHIDYAVNGLEDQLTFAFYGGGQSTAHPGLIAEANPAGKWSENSTLTGLTYAAVFFIYKKDSPLYDNGIPDLTFEMDGALLYDLRQDSTNGGSGGQRWDDPATWGFSSNPAVAVYNYLRGFYLNGERIIGMGVPAYDLISETFIAAANACDEQVNLEISGTETRYRCATILSADEGVTHAASLETLLSTMAGYLYDYGGSYYCQAGVAQLPDGDVVTDADLVLGAPVTFCAKRSRADLVNRVHGQFLDPGVGYQAQSYGAQVSDGGAINDGEELGRSLDLLSVTSRTQAERIARIRLREVRAQATATITLGYDHLQRQVGDWLTWKSERFGERVYRIVDRQRDPQTLALTFQLTEITASVFNWFAADESAQPAGPVALIPGSRMTTVLGFGVQATTITSDGGSTEFPGIRFFWQPVTDPTVDTVVIEYRKVGSPTAARLTDPTPGDGTFTTWGGIVPGTDYEARATITTTPPRATTWTTWISMTTTDVYLVGVIADLTAQVRRDLLNLGLDKRVRELEDRVEQIAAAAATEAGTSYEARTLHKAVLDGRVKTAFSAIASETNLRIGATDALAETINVYAVRIENVSASLQQETRVRIDETGALAEQVSVLSTTVDGNTANLGVFANSVNGIKVQFGVVGQINGVTGGFLFQGVRQLDGSVYYSLGIQGDVIVDGTIYGLKLAANNIITASAQIGYLIVDNISIKNGAISQTTAGSSGGDTVYLDVNLRGTGSIVITAVYPGSTTPINALDFFALRIYDMTAGGSIIAESPVNTDTTGSGVSAYRVFGSTTAIFAGGAPPGYRRFAASLNKVQFATGYNIGGVVLTVTELSK